MARAPEGLSGALAALGMPSFSLSLMEAQAVLFHTELPSSFLEPGTAARGAGAGAAAALCCSVNVQLLQPKAAQTPPSPFEV